MTPLWSVGPVTSARRLFYGAARKGGATVIRHANASQETASEEDPVDTLHTEPPITPSGTAPLPESQGQPS
jgi:hypothetical protein